MSFQERTCLREDVSKPQIIGSRVCARIPGANTFPILDHQNTNGIFLGFTASKNNIHFEDDNICSVLTSTHVLFRKTRMSVTDYHIPLGA